MRSGVQTHTDRPRRVRLNREALRRTCWATTCLEGVAPPPHGSAAKIEQDPRSVPKTAAPGGPGGNPKETVSRRNGVSRAQLIHLPKLVVGAVTVAPTLLPRCNACNSWAVVILLLA